MSNELLEAAEKYDGIEEDMEDKITSRVHGEMDLIARDARQEAEDATGTLYRHLRSQPETTELTFSTGVVSSTISVPGFYKHTEYGTGARAKTGSDFYLLDDDIEPGKAPDPAPPLDKVETWIEEKPVEPMYYASQSDLAWAIRNSIAELGTHPSPFMRPAWEARYRTISDSVAWGIDALLHDYARR